MRCRSSCAHSFAECHCRRLRGQDSFDTNARACKSVCFGRVIRAPPLASALRKSAAAASSRLTENDGALAVTVHMLRSGIRNSLLATQGTEREAHVPERLSKRTKKVTRLVTSVAHATDLLHAHAG